MIPHPWSDRKRGRRFQPSFHLQHRRRAYRNQQEVKDLKWRLFWSLGLVLFGEISAKIHYVRTYSMYYVSIVSPLLFDGVEVCWKLFYLSFRCFEFFHLIRYIQGNKDSKNQNSTPLSECIWLQCAEFEMSVKAAGPSSHLHTRLEHWLNFLVLREEDGVLPCLVLPASTFKPQKKENIAGQI